MIVNRITGVIGAVIILTALAGCGKDEVSQMKVTTLWVNAASELAEEEGTETAPFKTISKALAVAVKGSLIIVKGGEYHENIVLSDGITLKGHQRENADRPVITAADAGETVIVMRDTSTIEFLRVTGGKYGILVDVNTNARIVNCEIVNNEENGIFFEDADERGNLAATVHIEGCLVSGNGDGIDLEGTKGVIRDCRLINNRDDGLDYDGNTNLSVFNTEIRDNKDDGIEIRLKRNSIAHIEGNIITGNGEDGVELINTPVKGKTSNQVTIVNNTIRENGRYGIGGVDQETEEVKEGLIIEGIKFEGNTIEKNLKAEIAGITRKVGS